MQSHFIFDCNVIQPKAILAELCRSRSLITLEFLQTPLTFPNVTFSFVGLLECITIKDASIIQMEMRLGINNAVSDLTDLQMITNKWLCGLHLLYSHPWSSNYVAFEERSKAIAMKTCSILLPKMTQFLWHLEIEISLFPQSLKNIWELPHLHTLIFYGSCSNAGDIDFMLLLRGIPLLNDLQFLLHQDHGNACGFGLAWSFLWPLQFTTKTLAVNHLLLCSFTLSNISPRDAIFLLLPSSVRHVSLPQIGEGDEHMGGCQMKNTYFQ